MLQYGADKLSDAELLAIIIRTGSVKERAVEVASKLFSVCLFEKGRTDLSLFSLPELTQFEGIGTVKALQILAAIELGKRMANPVRQTAPQFQTPVEVAGYYIPKLQNLEVEKVFLLLLNTKGRLLKELELSSGTINQSLISSREILIEALRYHAVTMILVHNHPSGDPTPSKSDIDVTKQLMEAAKLIGIPLMDHIIIGDTKYISLIEKGFL